MNADLLNKATKETEGKGLDFWAAVSQFFESLQYKMSVQLKILFVCGKNKWRSPTAAMIYRTDPRVSVRSAGVSDTARRKISERDLDWADLVLVMERRYMRRIHAQFRLRNAFPPMECLDIPDDYEFMDEELITLIRDGTEFQIKAYKTD
jgi:predicted protein tyrosine phosphatase